MVMPMTGRGMTVTLVSQRVQVKPPGVERISSDRVTAVCPGVIVSARALSAGSTGKVIIIAPIDPDESVWPNVA